MQNSNVIFIMGVSGSGKTTVGKALSVSLDLPFYDGDDFHPEPNKQKMSSGLALEDEDRWPWLQRLNEHAQAQTYGAIYACSALKESYREVLNKGLEKRVKWFHLTGDLDTIYNRMNARENHYMPSSLLQSQFDTLEAPKDAVNIDIEDSIESIINQMRDQLDKKKKDIGIIGLGVMGHNLARNMGRNEIALALYNRHVAGKEEQVAEKLIDKYDELKMASGFEDLAAFIAEIKRPRKILLMVTAGAMEDVLAQLVPLLKKGDLIIDGGNSDYKLTNSRTRSLETKGIEYMGMGISGGEKGALLGPAIMPGGKKEYYQSVEPILTKVAARNKNGQPCVKWMGKEGSGHFVKMIHNGIEYADMQLLAECYHILSSGSHLSNNEIAEIFSEWNQGDLSSYLLEISADIFTKKHGDEYLVDIILDKASNKGTGAWASIAGIEYGVPFNIIASALFARYTSSYKSDREKIATLYNEPDRSNAASIDRATLKNAYGVARLLNHLQGLQYIKTASEQNEWEVNLADVADVWTGGCIIRSALMFDLAERLQSNTDLLQDQKWLDDIKSLLPSLKSICSISLQLEIPIPTFTGCLNYFLAMKQKDSSANLIQAQRDYFGAHTYKLKSDPTGDSHHYNWQA